jgi:hypothetical protein
MRLPRKGLGKKTEGWFMQRNRYMSFIFHYKGDLEVNYSKTLELDCRNQKMQYFCVK